MGSYTDNCTDPTTPQARANPLEQVARPAHCVGVLTLPPHYNSAFTVKCPLISCPCVWPVLPDGQYTRKPLVLAAPDSIVPEPLAAASMFCRVVELAVTGLYRVGIAAARLGVLYGT